MFNTSANQTARHSVCARDFEKLGKFGWASGFYIGLVRVFPGIKRGEALRMNAAFVKQR
jgi:hypothetical protein